MHDSIDFILRFLAFAALHSLLALPRFKDWLRQTTGSGLRWYRLAYNLLAVVMFGWVMLAWQSTRVLYLVPGIGNLLMQGIQLAALLAMLACLRQTGLNRFLGVDPEADDHPTLCTSGCYAVVRHPLYLLGLIFFLGNPVMTTRWLTLTILGTVYLLVGALLEERRLLRQFGEAYARYQQQVPFLVPSPPRRASSVD